MSLLFAYFLGYNILSAIEHTDPNYPATIDVNIVYLNAMNVIVVQVAVSSVFQALYYAIRP